jgi:predicted NAD/FAD-binding protein
MKPTITIIGAGISGLSAGLHLHRKVLTSNFEADRVGEELKPMY